MLIAPAGEWRRLADHLETGKIKSRAEFLATRSGRTTVANRIRRACEGRMETAQVEVPADARDSKSLMMEADQIGLTAMRRASFWARDPLEQDTLLPLRELADRLRRNQCDLDACFRRVCFALDPQERNGATGGGIDRYDGDEEVLRLLADAKRRSEKLSDMGKLIYQRACERGL